MKPLFEPPPGAVPMAAKCEAYLTIHHPDNEQTTADGVQSNTHNPLAFVYLGECAAHMQDDGNVWCPTLSDLTEAGRMLVDVFRDNCPIRLGEMCILANISGPSVNDMAAQLAQQGHSAMVN